MRMPSDPVSTSRAGPWIGDLGPTLQIYGAHHRFIWRITGTVLRSMDLTLIVCKDGGIVSMQGPEIFTPLLPESVPA